MPRRAEVKTRRDLLEEQLAGIDCLTAVKNSGLLSSRPRRWAGRDLLAAGIRKGGPAVSSSVIVSLMQAMGVTCLQPGGGTFKAGYRSDDIVLAWPLLDQIRAEVLAGIEEERTGVARKATPEPELDWRDVGKVLDRERAEVRQARLMVEAEEM